MFGTQFYPTPREVAQKMIEPVLQRVQAGACILEPSAGRGDLLKALRSAGAKKEQMYAIELDPDLNTMLKGWEYRVIGEDFLAYSGTLWFDLVIMNPPFANGEHHVLKAWEVVAPGGTVVALLNQETLLNQHTGHRELLGNIITDNGGEVTYLGNCFSTADRRTDVEVAMVVLHKPELKNGFDFDYKGTTGTPEMPNITQDMATNALQHFDQFDALVSAYQRAGHAYLEHRRAVDNLSSIVGHFKNARGVYAIGVDPYKAAEQAAKALPKSATRREVYTAAHNGFMLEFQRICWEYLFAQTNIKAIVTTKVQEQFDLFIKQQGGIDFTRENIFAVFQMLIDNKDARLLDCMMEVFDRMTRYHEKNRVHFEGWKTNDAYKVNRKVIMPNFIEVWRHPSSRYGKHGYCHSFHLYGRSAFLDDIDKVMCMLTGKCFAKTSDDDPREPIGTTHNALYNKFRIVGDVYTGDSFDGTTESEFFDIKFFLKGTLHLTFKDEKLWQEFNQRVAKGKGWLPEETTEK